MTAITIQCDGCGARFYGRDECEAEGKWSMHQCPNAPDYSSMSLDKLRQRAYAAAGFPDGPPAPSDIEKQDEFYGMQRTDADMAADYDADAQRGIVNPFLA